MVLGFDRRKIRRSNLSGNQKACDAFWNCCTRADKDYSSDSSAHTTVAICDGLFNKLDVDHPQMKASQEYDCGRVHRLLRNLRSGYLSAGTVKYDADCDEDPEEQ